MFRNWQPTTTDTTVNFLSNHPIEHKMAAFRFHISKMYSLPLDSEKKQKDCEIIQTIAKNNNIPQNVFQKLNRQVHRKIDCKLKKKTKKKCLDHLHISQSAGPPARPSLQPTRHISCATNPSMDALPANRTWQPSCSYGKYQHEAITSRSRYLLMMGTWLPETFWETSRREIKDTQVTCIWFSYPHCVTVLESYTQSIYLTTPHKILFISR